MPLASHPTFEVIAFHAPVVEGEVLRIPVHTDTGMRLLKAPVELWNAGIASIAAAIKAGELAPGAKRPKHVVIAPAAPRSAIAEKYEAALEDFRSGKAPSKTAAAIARGVKPANFYVWLTNQKKRAAKNSTREPVLKPKGTIA